MIELIAIIISIGSFLGMGIIVFRKLPVLAELPESPIEFDLKEKLLKIKEKVKILNPFKGFSTEIFLQKILSKIRILTLKTENKTASWLQKLREKAQKRKSQENANYWRELKKSTKNKK